MYHQCFLKSTSYPVHLNISLSCRIAGVNTLLLIQNNEDERRKTERYGIWCCLCMVLYYQQQYIYIYIYIYTYICYATYQRIDTE